MVILAPAHAALSLTFGVYTSDKPTAMVLQLRPTLNVLEKSLGKILGEPVKIRMRVARDYKVGVALITSGEVDFARLGAASYVRAKEAAPGIKLLAAERYHETHFFKGVICVKTNGPIRRVEELKGKTFAFGSKRSTIGRYLAQLYLAHAGIHASDLRAYAYLGRHDRVGEAVGSGQFDAGALEETIFKKLVASGVPIRPIATFPNVTKAWVARAGLDPRIVRALHRGLLAVKDPAVLAALRFGGFVNVDDVDYRMIRTAIKENGEFFQAGRVMPASR
jgi:ABC-type phosphate/phosphonate transport system substrate-binding protein